MDDSVGDRVYEAYFGAMGNPFALATRERIHWLCERVRGERILDVGCSQGITSILLGKEGKKVEGIDVDETAVKFATQKIQEEDDEIRSNVTFKVSNFLSASYEPGEFDTIILSEILEHLVNPEAFLEKASYLLGNKGRLLITVPFGINDAPDHKRTYYGLNLVLRLLADYSIKDLKVVSNSWLCLVCDIVVQGQNEASMELPEILGLLEVELTARERRLANEKLDLVNANERLKKNLESQSSVKDLNGLMTKEFFNLTRRLVILETVSSSIDKLDAKNEKGQGQINDLRRDNVKMTDDIRSLRSLLQSSFENFESKNLLWLEEMKVNQKELKLERAILNAEIQNRNNKIDQLEASLRRDRSQIQEIQSRKKELEDMLNIVNPKYSKLTQDYEAVKRERNETSLRLKTISDKLAIEIKEEERLLREYSKMKKEYEVLVKKNRMFERSQSGRIITYSWKVLNKIRGSSKSRKKA
jgi:SAM-dependent methyltransferase